MDLFSARGWAEKEELGLKPKGKKLDQKGAGETEPQPLLEAGELTCQTCHSASVTAGGGGYKSPSIPTPFQVSLPLKNLKSAETNSQNKQFYNVQESKFKKFKNTDM